MLVLVVVVEFDLVVVLPLAEFEVVVVLVVVLEPLLLPPLAGVTLAGVIAGVAVDAGLDAVFDLLAFEAPLPALFVAVLSGQAAPNKPNVKTAERAITFFISIKFSCLLQRMYIFYLFYDPPKKVVFRKVILEQWTI